MKGNQHPTYRKFGRDHRAYRGSKGDLQLRDERLVLIEKYRAQNERGEHITFEKPMRDLT